MKLKVYRLVENFIVLTFLREESKKQIISLHEEQRNFFLCEIDFLRESEKKNENAVPSCLFILSSLTHLNIAVAWSKYSSHANTREIRRAAYEQLARTLPESHPFLLYFFFLPKTNANSSSFDVTRLAAYFDHLCNHVNENFHHFVDRTQNI